MTTWLSAAAPSSLNADGGWSAYTIRQIIDVSKISNAGLAYVRVTFRSGSAGGVVVGSAYIGQKADSGEAYSFQSTPTELKFSGVSGFSISANTSIVSDTTVFTIPTGKSILVTYYVSSGYMRQKSSETGWQVYYDSINNPSTVTVSGYSNLGAYATGVLLVEAGYDDASSGLIVWY